MAFPCGECPNKDYPTWGHRAYHRVLEHPLFYPNEHGGSCFFCLKQVLNYFHVHDHVKKWHYIEHMILCRMADKLNAQVAVPKTTYFWLQVLFLHPGEQRAAVMSGEEIMNHLWNKMEQLAAGVNEAAKNPLRISQAPQPMGGQAFTSQPSGDSLYFNQPTTSMPTANYPLQIDMGNGMIASLVQQRFEPPGIVAQTLAKHAQTGVIHPPSNDDENSSNDGVEIMAVKSTASSKENGTTPSKQSQISNGTTIPPLDFSLVQTISLPQGLLPICTPLTPSMMAALMGTPIVAAGSSQEDMQKIVEQQMIGGCGVQPMPQQFAPSQMAALMGTPIIADNNNSQESLQERVEQQMSSNNPSNGQAFADMPMLPQELTASMMAALMGTPIVPTGSSDNGSSLEEIVEQQMSGGRTSVIEPQPVETSISDTNEIATPPMLFATHDDEEATNEVVEEQEEEVSSVIEPHPQEVIPPVHVDAATSPVFLASGSCLETLMEVVDQPVNEASSCKDDSVVFKVPLLPHERPTRSSSGEPSAKKARRQPKIKGTAQEPSVADVLKKIQSSGYKLQPSKSKANRPSYRRWSLQSILRTLVSVPHPNTIKPVDPSVKRDKSNSSQLAVVITSILCMRSELYLKRAKEIELELTAAFRHSNVFPEDDAALDAQLRATKYDINLRVYDPLISPNMILQPAIDEGWEISNVFIACLPLQWREQVSTTFELVRHTLILLMSQHPPLKDKLVRLKELLQEHVYACVSTCPKLRAWILKMRRQLYGCDAPMPAWTVEADARRAARELAASNPVASPVGEAPQPPPEEEFPDPMMAPPVSPLENGVIFMQSPAPVPVEAEVEDDQSSTEQVSAMVAKIMRCTKAAEEAASVVTKTSVRATVKAVFAVAASDSSPTTAASAQSSTASTSKTSPAPATSAPTTPPDANNSSSSETSNQPVASTSSGDDSEPAEKQTATSAELAQVMSAIAEASKSLNQPIELRPFLPFADAEQQYAEDRRIWLQKEKVSCRYGCPMMASSSGMVSHYRRYHYDVYFQAVHKACKEMSVKRWLNVRFGDEKACKKEDKQDKRSCLACRDETRPGKPEYYDRLHLARHFKQSHPAYFAAIRDDYFNVFNGLIEDDPIVHFLVEK